MSHGPQRQDIHKEIKNTLAAKERFGQSRHEAKSKGIEHEGIYSYNTAHVYNRECQRFAEYVCEVSPQGRYTSVEDAREYAKDYIQAHNADPSISPYTVKMQASALGKLYSCEYTEFGATNPRHRADITRSRERTIISEKTGKEILNPSTRAGHFSEKNNSEFVNFCRGTGLRRAEITALKGNQFVEIDGKPYLDVFGKGGRERLLPIVGENAQAIIDRCRAAGNDKVWETVPARADIHHYRSQYATNMYKSIARDRDQIPPKERYCCRGELKGVWYDRPAMLVVSQALGHNRVSVIAEHYLR